MSDAIAVPGNRIRSFVERIEQLETEIHELNEGKKEVFAEAKGEGFDVGKGGAEILCAVLHGKVRALLERPAAN